MILDRLLLSGGAASGGGLRSKIVERGSSHQVAHKFAGIIYTG